MSLDFNFSLEELEAAEAATANPYLSDPAQGLQLVTRLIAQPGGEASGEQRRHLHRLHQLIHQSFVGLAARDDYPAEAQSYRELIALERSLEDLAAFPDLANKTVIGVGGGFSAGKSRFLNSLLGVDLLPEALEPTTAIPSYLAWGERESIVALNCFAQEVRLDRQALLAITHAFHKHYRQLFGVEVGFAHIVRLLMIHRPELPWRRLAFIDTPGYSKADRDDAAYSDARIAHRQLAEADHVLWLLSAKNGSIRRDDLEFLRTLDHPKPVFFVITQADLVGHARIRAILDSTAEALDNAGIERAGLMAWSAPPGDLSGQLMAGDDVRAWLGRLDATPKRTQKRLACARILDAHIAYNDNALANNRGLLAAMNELLPIAGGLADNRLEAVRQQVDRLRNDQHRLAGLVGEFGELKQTVGHTRVRAILDSIAEALDNAGIERAGRMAWAASPGEPDGQPMAGDDVRTWLDRLDATPKRTQKRLACARILDAHIAYNGNALANNRGLLAAMNELLPIASGLADNRLEAVRQQVDRLRDDQHRLAELVGEFGELKQAMLEVVTQIVGSLAEDEAVQRGHELTTP